MLGALAPSNSPPSAERDDIFQAFQFPKSRTAALVPRPMKPTAAWRSTEEEALLPMTLRHFCWTAGCLRTGRTRSDRRALTGKVIARANVKNPSGCPPLPMGSLRCLRYSYLHVAPPESGERTCEERSHVSSEHESSLPGLKETGRMRSIGAGLQPAISGAVRQIFINLSKELAYGALKHRKPLDDGRHDSENTQESNNRSDRISQEHTDP